MSFPLQKYRIATLEARRSMTPNERLIEGEKDLRFWTNTGIIIAIIIGVIVIASHGGVLSAGIAAFGAALGLGGVLGFLFGVPSASRAPININNASTVAVSTGNESKTAGGNVSVPPADPNINAPTPPVPVDPEPAPIAPTEPAVPATTTVAATPAVTAAVAPAAAAPAPEAPADTVVAPAVVAAPAVAPAPPVVATPPVAAAPEVAAPPPVPPQPSAAVPGVSNLEQVADWVTKLLLGGGLTQMQRIPPKVWQWSHAVAMGIIGDDPKINPQMIVSQQAFAAGVLVYGFILGFFSGFLITKLQLGKAIAD